MRRHKVSEDEPAYTGHFDDGPKPVIVLPGAPVEAQVSYDLAMSMVSFCSAALGLAEKDVAAVDYAIRKMAEDPEFLSKSHATEEQIIRAIWPDRKVN